MKRHLLLFILAFLSIQGMAVASNGGDDVIGGEAKVLPNWDAKVYPNPNNGVFNVMVNGSSTAPHPVTCCLLALRWSCQWRGTRRTHTPGGFASRTGGKSSSSPKGGGRTPSTTGAFSPGRGSPEGGGRSSLEGGGRSERSPSAG